MAEHERLLPGLEARQHRLQLARPAGAAQDGVDVAVVVELAGDARADLAQHLVVDAGRALVDHEQRDVVLAHLAGDRAEDGLPGDPRSQETVRLLDRDDQRLGRLAVGGERLLGAATVLLVDAPSDEVRDQQVRRQIVAVAPEFEDDVAAVGEVVEHALDGALAVVPHEVEPLELPQPLPQRVERAAAPADVLG